jgi:F1F0 ATPase subunit 2
MDTIEVFPLMVASAAGIVLGVIFFGGLWLTVQKGIKSKHPELWFLGSLLLRNSICLSGFYWIGKDNPERLLICLVSFIATRMLVMRMTHQRHNSDQTSENESDCAS